MVKRVLLLTDEKAGHQNQGRALVRELEEIAQESGGLYQLYTTIIKIRFKSQILKGILSLYTLLIYPFVKTNVPFLSNFIEEDRLNEIKKQKFDIVISVGSGVIPFNLLISKVNGAKRIILMSPSFPFNFFTYDLAIISYHDKAWLVKNKFKKLLTPSSFCLKVIEAETEVLRNKLSNPERVQIGLLIGGDSKNYNFNRQAMDVALEKIIAACRELDVDFIATTCRRTPEDYVIHIKERLVRERHCQLLVLAERQEASNLVPTLSTFCKIVITPEESISMICEPLGLGKKILILKLNKNIPSKYSYFHKLLLENNLVHIVNYSDLADKIAEIYHNGSYVIDKEGRDLLAQEDRLLRERLTKLL